MTSQIRAKAPAAIAQAWSLSETNDQAADALRAMMADDPQLYREIVAPFEAQAAMLAVQRQKIARRHHIWTRPAAVDDRVALLARTNAVTLLDMRLPSGKRLGDAVVDDIREAEAVYSAQAKFAGDKVRFFAAVAQKMTGRKTVSQVWTAAELEELK